MKFNVNKMKRNYKKMKTNLQQTKLNFQQMSDHISNFDFTFLKPNSISQILLTSNESE